ncbi:MAG TPA: hypothetical protein VK738_08800 [Terriglobales bacterium]|jgi:hypothetical protein|nr:hypothetical protein [Terriglobales bacterium]
MIIFGTRGDTHELGDLGMRSCPVCQADRPFKTVVSYRYFHIWFFFGMVTSQKFIEMCTICRRGREIASENARNLVNTSPIPFMRRFGLLILVVVVVGIVAYSSMAK